MLKKYTAILFLIAACATLLGHSIIPHHHHETEQELAEHFQTNHHNEGDESSRDFSHNLSHFIHSSDSFTTPTVHNIGNTFYKQFRSLAAVLPADFSVDEFLISPSLHKPPAEQFICISPHSLSLGLRAPPAFIA